MCPAALLVTLGLIVSAAGLATIGVHAHWSPDGRTASDTALAVLCLATGAVCFTRYRSSGDTHPLFVCAGLLLVAVQTVAFDQHWIVSDSYSPWEGLTFPARGWFAAWLLAAIAFVLARPWWDLTWATKAWEAGGKEFKIGSKSIGKLTFYGTVIGTGIDFGCRLLGQ